jgi:hypothetical protein
MNLKIHNLLRFLSTVFKDSVNSREYTASGRDEIKGIGHNWNVLVGENRSTRRKTCSNTNLFTTNSTRTGPGLNPEFRNREHGE